MKPYYEHGGITIYHGDCRDALAAVPECDLLLTDPPYGVAWRRTGYSACAPMVGDVDTTSVLEALQLAIKRLRLSRHAYVFGPLDLSELRLCSVTELVWDKGGVGVGNLSLPWSTSHERITFGVRFVGPRQKANGRGALAARLRKGSVLRYQRLYSGQNSRHPTEKPVALLRELIESSSHIGELVLDPFCGSGSTLVAATREGRRAIGIEIEERYCEIAARRLQQEAPPLEIGA